MFEIIIGLINGGMVLAILYIMRQLSHEGRDAFGRSVKLDERINKLENETRYVADQPQRYFSIGSSYFDTNELHKNDVAITDVVKAIVKHLDMQIEKVDAKTTETPMQVKVVEKPKMHVGPTGVVVMADGSGIPMPGAKTKRKYTKRKSK